MLNEKVLTSIDKLISISQDFVFCGSVALCAQGLMDREIRDIDVVVEKGTPLEKFGISTVFPVLNDIKNPQVFHNELGKEIYLVKIDVDGTGVDVFLVTKVNCVDIEFYGRKIRVQSLNDLLSAKRAWIKYSNKEKHKKDMEEIEKAIFVRNVK